jgi:anti-sigma-K factor RskA
MTAEVHSLVGAYVLDAVDDLERAAVDRHLRECEDCRAEADELREAVARLADGTWSVPPPRLRTNVLAAIAETRQLAPSAPDVSAARRAASRWRRLTAAAAVVVVVGAAGYAVQEPRVRHERALAEAAQASEARVRSILAAPDLVVREETLTSGGRVTVASSRLHDAGVIMLAADGAPADGRVYQLWTVRSRTAAGVGTLEPGQSAIVQIVEGLPQASDVGVTVEPAGGSRTPTAPMIADVKLT